MSRLSKSIKRLAIGFACGMSVATTILAQSVMESEVTSIHGFAMVGFIATRGNNFYGNTRHGGDVDYYEAGINAYRNLTPQVSVAGQVMTRRAGHTDDGSLRVDYAFVDVHSSLTGNDAYGLRLGRVRNPLGFYNESRDVIFTRPSVLLPQSTYFEGTGVREMVFSSDGVQFYGEFSGGETRTELKLSLIPTKQASDQSLDNFSAGLPPGTSLSMDVDHPVFAQVLHERDGARQRYALSYIDIGLRGEYRLPSLPVPLAFELKSKLYALSAQYNSDDWSLTSEYRLTSSRSKQTGSPSMSFLGDGLYVQYQYRFSPTWTALLRVDRDYPDRGNRSRNVGKDTTVGLSWRPHHNWQLNLEYHRISGISGVPLPDNRHGLKERTDLLAFTAGFRF